MIPTATSAVTWTSVRANSNPRSKDGDKSGVEWMVMKPKTLVDHGNPQFYPGVYVAVITLLTSCVNLHC